MNGFTISTTTCTANVQSCLVSGATGSGISCSNDNTEITNGSVVAFTIGVYAKGVGTLVEKVSAKSNYTGFWVGASIIRNCSASKNWGGMEAQNAVIEGNTFSLNAYGLSGLYSTILANTFIYNSQTGLSVFYSVYGSNNIADSLFIGGSLSGNTSQNNNNCLGTLC